MYTFTVKSMKDNLSAIRKVQSKAVPEAVKTVYIREDAAR